MKELQAKEESEEAPYLSTRPQLLVRPQFQAELPPDRPQGSAGSMLHGGLDPQWPEWVHGGRLHRACPNCFARALQLVRPNHRCQMSPTRLASVKHDHLIIIAGAKVIATFVILITIFITINITIIIIFLSLKNGWQCVEAVPGCQGGKVGKERKYKYRC